PLPLRLLKRPSAGRCLPSFPTRRSSELGLRDNGRTVLTYAMLKSAFPDPDGREPGREIELHLTGHMEKFAWGFNGQKFSDAAPLDRKSTRLNSSHVKISYAVFCLKKKKL